MACRDDSSVFSQNSLYKDTGRSVYEVFAERGVYLEKASNSRVPGWLDLKEYLKVRPETGKPKLYIFSNCRQTIKSIPMLLHDEKHPDDVAIEPHRRDPCPRRTPCTGKPCRPR